MIALPFFFLHLFIFHSSSPCCVEFLLHSRSQRLMHAPQLNPSLKSFLEDPDHVHVQCNVSLPKLLAHLLNSLQHLSHMLVWIWNATVNCTSVQYIYLSDEFTKSQVQLCMWFCSAQVLLSPWFQTPMLIRLLFSARLMGSAHDGVKLFEIVENLEQMKFLAWNFGWSPASHGWSPAFSWFETQQICLLQCFE
jgi:hypothetical protein